MISKKKNFLNIVRLILLSAPLFLTACHSDFGPFPMPSGYAHHNKEHKAAPGPEPVLKKIEHKIETMHIPQSIETTNTNTKDNMMMATTQAPIPVNIPAPMPPANSSWDHAVHDLLTRLVDGFGQPVEPVYINPANPVSQTEMNLEKALRLTMMQKNFNVAPAPGMGPFTMRYTASNLVGIGDGSRMIVTLSLMAKDKKMAEESGIYELGHVVVSTQPMPQPHEHSGPAMAEPLSISR